MLGWKLVPKREILLWSATIQDLRDEVKRLREERDHERERSEAAINGLLAKSAGMVINTPHQPTAAEIEKLQRISMDLFDEADEREEEAQRMKEMQS